MLADGLAASGPEEARKRLADFWRSASVGGDLLPVQRAIVEKLFSLLPMPGAPSLFSAWSGFFSPYDLNPLNINPLKDLIERFVNFERLRNGKREMYVAATNVQTGQLHIFTRASLSAEAVMASACLPAIFRAVEIDGVPYWDGGYLGNPVIFPFFRSTQTEDVLIVQINPLMRKKVPTSNREIMSRVQEISFNSSLLVELRAIEFVNRMIDEGRLPRGTAEGEFRKIRVHRIVLEGLRGEVTIAELCRREGIHPNMYYKWSKDFLEAGKQRLVGDMRREADSQEVKEMRAENEQLKAVVAELTLKNRVLKKSLLGKETKWDE